MDPLALSIRLAIHRLLVVALAACLPGLAIAQVAAPVLNPTAMLVTTLNPAVLQWSAPSRVTLGWYTSDLTNFDATGTPTSTSDSDGWYVQGRAVGESFAVGAEQLNLTIQPSVGNATDYQQTQAALAGQMGGVMALGLGASQEQVTTNPGPTATHDLTLVGFSGRLQERFYLGIARGNETRQFPTLNTSVERPVTYFGIAYHQRGDTHGFHLEVNREQRESYDLETSPGVFSTRDEQTQDRVVLEVIAANILVGLASTHLTVDSPSLNSHLEEDRQIASLGWVPAQGLAVVLRRETRALDNSNGTRQERTLDRLAVAWQF